MTTARNSTRKYFRKSPLNRRCCPLMARGPQPMPPKAGGECPAHSGHQKQEPAGSGPWPFARLSFGHLVRLRQERWRHGEPKRLCSLEIDDEVVLGRLLDGHLA